jgi:hypothetical protein
LLFYLNVETSFGLREVADLKMVSHPPARKSASGPENTKPGAADQMVEQTISTSKSATDPAFVNFAGFEKNLVASDKGSSPGPHPSRLEQRVSTAGQRLRQPRRESYDHEGCERWIIQFLATASVFATFGQGKGIRSRKQ